MENYKIDIENNKKEEVSPRRLLKNLWSERGGGL